MSPFMSPGGMFASISFIFIAAGVFGLLLGSLFQQRGWIILGGAFFIGGAVGIIMSYFDENPKEFFEKRNVIALILIPIIIAFIKGLRR